MSAILTTKNEDESKKYIMTWGRHDYYWQKQLEVVLETLGPSDQLKQRICEALSFLNDQLEFLFIYWSSFQEYRL